MLGNQMLGNQMLGNQMLGNQMLGNQMLGNQMLGNQMLGNQMFIINFVLSVVGKELFCEISDKLDHRWEEMFAIIYQVQKVYKLMTKRA